jgi:predicted GIY-YIG superfamily endonuclease
MYYLYYLKSTLDDKIYIGITNNPDRRYYEHINYTVEKNHYNGNWIRKTLKKGGEIKMTIALSGLSKKVAIQLEIKLISLFKKVTPKKVTNTAQGGLGFNHKGIPHSEEHNRALEAAQPHKVRISKDILYDLYVNKKLSKKKIGEIYGCGATTIDRRLIEYNIKPRRTPNYKISYKLNKEEILDMYINKRMTISKISDILGIGSSGVRYLLQREGIDTGLNRFNRSFDKEKIKQKYEELIKMNIKKMKIYKILSNEFNLSSGYLSKIKYNV